MLPDPVAVKMPVTPGTLPTDPMVQLPNFARLEAKGGTGLYVSTDSPFNLDQKCGLTIKSNPKTGGIGRALVRFDREINVAAVNGIPQPDAVASAWIGWSGNVQLFTKAQFLDLLFMAYRTAVDQYDKIASGQV